MQAGLRQEHHAEENERRNIMSCFVFRSRFIKIRAACRNDLYKNDQEELKKCENQVVEYIMSHSMNEISKVDDKEFFKMKGYSFSAMKELFKSPLHFWKYFEIKKPQTPAMILGSCIHCAILEPEKFHEKYLADPGLDKRTKGYRIYTK